MESLVIFSRKWTSSDLFEQALEGAIPPPQSRDVFSVRFVVKADCALMVDAGVKLLSCANQLVAMTKKVTIEFEGGPSGTMGYLNRMGFFDFLHRDIIVRPSRPETSGASVFGGSNRNLVEFKALDPVRVDRALPGVLTDSLVNGSGISKAKQGLLNNAAFTIFSELIGNVYRHSETMIAGFAALQFYPRGKKVTVAVSDSGLGIMRTLRPTLRKNFPELENQPDEALLTRMVSEGISRFGSENGCGVRQCARSALALNASMEIRMPTSRVTFRRIHRRQSLGVATYTTGMPQLWGTHVCLDFELD